MYKIIMEDQIPMNASISMQQDDSKIDITCTKIKIEHNEVENRDCINEEHVYGTQTDDKELWIKQEQEYEENKLLEEIKHEKVTNLDTPDLEPPSNTDGDKLMWVKQEQESVEDNNLLVVIKHKEDTNVDTPEQEPPSNPEDLEKVWIKSELESDEDDNLLIPIRYEEVTNLKVPKLEPPLNTDEKNCAECPRELASPVVTSATLQEHMKPSDTTVKYHTYTEEIKSSTQRVREWRARQKFLRALKSADDNQSSNVTRSGKLGGARERARIMLNSDLSKLVYQRLTSATRRVLKECRQNPLIANTVQPKTSTQRSREWRARQKFLRALKPAADDQSANTVEMKTATQRSREYRARKKLP